MKAQLKRLSPDYPIKPFDCKDADLNGFLLETDHTIANARHHAKELLAVTYLIEDEDTGRTIAYFSLLNDKIEREFTDDAVWKRISRNIPNAKRRQSHPAVKLGRLAVSCAYQRQNWGKMIIDLIKQWFTRENKTGCRYITVDALNSARGFYEKNGFSPLVADDTDGDTILMYYDLKKFMNEHSAQ